MVGPFGMQSEVCAACGIEFAMPGHFVASRRRDGKSFYCPNGHKLSFGEGENEKLRRERDRLKQQQAQLNDEIESERRRTAAQKAQVTRLKNRAKAGICPCCTRHFTNLERHIASKHPDFDNVVDIKEATHG